MRDIDILETAKEVFEIEAHSIERLKNQIDENFIAAIKTILATKGRVVFSGIGKSGIIGKKIAATLASTGTPTIFIHPAEALHGDLGLITKNDIFVAISYSGETEELLRIIPYLKENQIPIISMTGNLNSTLAKNSNYVLNIKVEKEACPLQLAPTSSTTATLAMGDAIAVVLMKLKNFKQENFAQYHPGGSLGKKLLSKVADYMKTENLPIVKENYNFKKIVEVMTAGRLGLAIIVDNNENLIGIFTDGDLRRTFEKYSIHELENIKISQIMTKNPKVINKEAKLIEAQELMNKYKITSLIVTENQKVIGVIQIYDISF